MHRERGIDNQSRKHCVSGVRTHITPFVAPIRLRISTKGNYKRVTWPSYRQSSLLRTFKMSNQPTSTPIDMPTPPLRVASTNTLVAEPGPSSGTATHHPSWNSSIFTPRNSISLSPPRASSLGSQSSGPNDKGSTTSLNKPPPYERRRSVSFMRQPEERIIDERSNLSVSEGEEVAEADKDDEDEVEDGTEARSREEKSHGMLSRMIALYAEEAKDKGTSPLQGIKGKINDVTDTTGGDYTGLHKRSYSTASRTSMGAQAVDEDDLRVTGKRKHLHDIEDLEKLTMRHMDYKNRRKQHNRMRIIFNITSLANRQIFLLTLTRALITFASPPHRLESQLSAAANMLEVNAEFVRIPGTVIVSFGDPETRTSEMHFVRCSSSLCLKSLHQVHMIYRQVVHDELSARKATEMLEELIRMPPTRSQFADASLSFSMSALICPLAFGGSFLDMWVAGSLAFCLSYVRSYVTVKNDVFSNVFEITASVVVSFVSRALSSIRSQIFCYTAITSGSIISLLPGFLILTGSLELASKQKVCGSVNMVYALIYTIFLGFGLEVGSELFLAFDHPGRRLLNAALESQVTSVTLAGAFAPTNGTFSQIAANIGTYTFTHYIAPNAADYSGTCYRPSSAPWYLKPFPSWTQYIIVPVFSVLSSLTNHAPVKGWELPVMVVISCAAYASNALATHYIFDRSDIVSAIGAFTIGLLGNLYSRKMGGTAFTSMVTGVLFLVPSGLSQAGGITTDGTGLGIEGAMINTAIGITVGLFMSQAFVYMFGSKKNAASFSF